jgi:hypothetical protein
MLPDELTDCNPEIPAGVPGPPDAIPAEPRCPWCGRSWPYLPRQSGMLDMVQLAQAVLSDLQAAIEAEVLP